MECRWRPWTLTAHHPTTGSPTASRAEPRTNSSSTRRREGSTWRRERRWIPTRVFRAAPPTSCTSLPSTAASTATSCTPPPTCPSSSKTSTTNGPSWSSIPPLSTWRRTRPSESSSRDCRPPMPMNAPFCATRSITRPVKDAPNRVIYCAPKCTTSARGSRSTRTTVASASSGSWIAKGPKGFAWSSAFKTWPLSLHTKPPPVNSLDSSVRLTQIWLMLLILLILLLLLLKFCQNITKITRIWLVLLILLLLLLK